MTGLTSHHARELLKQHGPNSIVEKSHRSIIHVLAEQFMNFLTILLVIAAFLSFFIGETVDGALILTILILNATFGLYQEYKAESAIAALKKMTVSMVRVIRDGKEQQIENVQLVPGDIVILAEGDKVPADATVTDVHALEVNEASLTGESVPVSKVSQDQIYMGTIVTKGRAIAHITHTGMETKFGIIADKLTRVQKIETPLQKKITKLSELIGIVGIVLSFMVFVLSSLQGNGYLPSFLLAISLAVALVPEGLPAVMTIILSMGVKRMAARGAIVRKLTAIEALGSTTLIATDKTGTLTQNNMHVNEIWFHNKLVKPTELPKQSSVDSVLLLTDGVVCSTASLVIQHDSEKCEILGDPTEGALLCLAKNHGIDVIQMRSEWKLTDEIAFNSLTKRMSVVVTKDEPVLFSKGAPESLLAICSHIQVGSNVRKITKEDQSEIHDQLTSWAKDGLRVLAMGYKNDPDDHLIKRLKHRNEHGDGGLAPLSDGLVFIGMTALEDPPRSEVPDAIARAKKAGITVVMITGDNEKTAENIGTRVGLLKKGDIILKGEQIDTMSDKELMAMLPHVRIFARATPFHKSRIVSLYQQMGEVVTVTGDGVNDAIALKQANVGVAMGLVGTDVARETADIIITDDNFATIVNAIEEGRNIALRLNNSIKYLLTGNLSEGLALLGGLALGMPPILLPIQLLYINLISDGLPALAFAFSPQSSHVMSHKPQKDSAILRLKDYEYIVPIGLLVALMVIGAYVFFSSSQMGAQTAAFTVLALIQAVIFADIWLRQHKQSQSPHTYISAMFVFAVGIPIIFQYALVRIPFIAEAFHIHVLSIRRFVGYIAYSGLLYVLLWIYRGYRSMAATKR
ncbi:MAG: cation-translocating P-type ATPase [bacterium]|nr:cation-translocating P-type ATPase [bacterium]